MIQILNYINQYKQLTYYVKEQTVEIEYPMHVPFTINIYLQIPPCQHSGQQPTFLDILNELHLW